MKMVIKMKIIIADAKSLKYQNHHIQGVSPLFQKKTQYLIDLLKQLDVNDIHDLMNISFKQSQLIYDYYHHNDHLYPALSLFHGVVYKELDIKNYHDKEFDYLEKYLIINSPLYGLLRYHDLIGMHRLEMKNHINDIHLYQYWQEEIDNYFKNEDFIISLSTKEYERMIHHPHLIQIDFGDISGEKIKRNAVYLKKARGKMLDYMIKHHLTDIEEIKKIIVDDYIYQPDLSTQKKLVFLRNEKMVYKKL